MSDTPYSQMEANTIQLAPNVDTSIVRADAGQRVRRWRVGMLRLDRLDNFAPLVDGNAASGTPQAALVSNAYSYAAGFQSVPSWIPARTNPVNYAFDLSVQVEWGYGGANPARLAAQWPRMGSSIVVVGSYVQVSARWTANGAPDPNARPLATAWIAPDDGQLVVDAGELSLSQEIFVRNVPPSNTQLGAVYVPDFARRVRVSLARNDPFSAAQRTVPLNGEPCCVGAWIDDTGAARGGWQQGIFTSLGGVEHFADVVWHPVPAAATMLALISPTSSSTSAFVEWRIAP